MADHEAVSTPSVSQYIANLNTIQSPTDAEQNPEVSLDDDLALFTDTQFFDFDMGQFGDVTEPLEFDPAQENQSRRQNAAAKSGLDQSFDFGNGKLILTILSCFLHRIRLSTHIRTCILTNMANTVVTVAVPVPDLQQFHNVPSDVSIMSVPLPQANQYQYPDLSSPINITSPIAIGPLNPGEKRKHDAMEARVPLSVEEASRLAAEEDKRRRNTAASARFRIKKKQREQALEKTAKEMTDKVSTLEARINQLEMENKWLKSLITEKNDNNEGMADLYRKFTKGHGDARSTSERKNGVGTVKNETGTKNVKDEKSAE